MTNDDKALVGIANRIREKGKAFEYVTIPESFIPRMMDRIEDLEAENERLREALEEVKRSYPEDGCDIASAALGDAK